MHPLSFESAALKNWARFSGDFNPIHFDDNVAELAVGRGGVVIHGMLAMLTIKSLHDDSDGDGEDWLQWHAMLRKAMPLRDTYMLESKPAPRGGGVRFKLIGKSDAEAKITGSFASTSPPPRELSACDRLEVDVAAAKAELAEFMKLFPTASAAWIAFDAFVFARYIKYHAATGFQDDLRKHFGSELNADLSSGKLVTMQTHHTDHYARSMRRPVTAIEIARIEYGIVKTDELLSNDSLFATVNIPIWINSVLVQVVQIGLMARKMSSATNGIRSQ